MIKASTIHFKKSDIPITTPTTKFGGQPVWLETPQWPISTESGNPMKFICQIVLENDLFPEASGKVAYIFMSDEEDVDGTWEPDGGENAVIIQPATNSISVKVQNVEKGPTLENEFAITLTRKEELSQQDIDNMPEEDQDAANEALSGNKLGGTPCFIQGEEFPKECKLLLLQLDSTQVPFYINFGDSGTAYIFINETATVGKFLWQCF